MGRLLLVSLPATCSVIYCCKHCDTHLAYATDIISRMFQCKHGKAYLVDKMVNVNVGEKENRMMTTGMHTVCDIFCVACGSILGWKYLAAFQKTQRYKEGKFIMDRKTVLPMAATPSSSASSTLQQQQQQHTTSADDDEEESEDDDEDSSSDHQD